MLVYFNITVIINFNPSSFQAKVISIGHTPHRQQNMRAFYILIIFFTIYIYNNFTLLFSSGNTF
jgi:hypothetical protein